MAGLSERRGRILAAVYREHGEAATWTPSGGGPAQAVRIRRMAGENVVNWGGSEAILPTLMVRVRMSEVSAPTDGDLVTVPTPAGDALIRLIADPRLEPLGLEWICEAKVDAP